MICLFDTDFKSLHGQGPEIVFLNHERTVIGRGETETAMVDVKIIAKLPIESLPDIISKRHAKIIKINQGFKLMDLKSTNGTFVNQIRVNEKILENGDVIQFGGFDSKNEYYPNRFGVKFMFFYRGLHLYSHLSVDKSIGDDMSTVIGEDEFKMPDQINGLYHIEHKATCRTKPQIQLYEIQAIELLKSIFVNIYLPPIFNINSESPIPELIEDRYVVKLFGGDIFFGQLKKFDVHLNAFRVMFTDGDWHYLGLVYALSWLVKTNKVPARAKQLISINLSRGRGFRLNHYMEDENQFDRTIVNDRIDYPDVDHRNIPHDNDGDDDISLSC